MRMFKKEEGFTLVELMVVVLIIGILVAIAIPVFNAAQESARKGACQNNLRVLDGAVQQFVADHPDNKTAVEGAANTAALGALKSAADPDGPSFSALYVKDWDGSTVCPSGTSETVTDATYTFNATNLEFACPNGHTY